MATILEDEDLIAQAQERERARLEEEAAILAFQQQQIQDAPPYPLIPAPEPVWAGSPTAEIDAFNAAPGVISAPTTIGSEQYMNELARAQRGSGFVNADVSPTGEVISAGYDPLKDFAALKAQQEATNLQRNQYVDSLIAGGATYAEAYRAGQGRYPQARNDAMRLKVEQLALRNQPFTPRVQTIGGVPMVERARGQWAPLPQQKFVGGKASEATKIAADNIADQITSLRRRLEPGPTGILLTPPEEVAAIKAEIAQKEKARVELFSGPESNPLVDQQGWRNMRQAWENPVSSRAPIPVAPTAGEQVVVSKDGRRYSLPKSQLEEALKAGYRQSQ